MVKFGKNKFKALHKLAKKQNATLSNAVSNKVIKKKINVEKKVSFQKEVFLKEAATESSLVTNVTVKDILLNDLSKKAAKKIKTQQETPKISKIKPVQKQKKRQKTQINDTKLLLSLMKKNKQ